MNEAPPPRIRPIWLIGGGAALAVLGVCALISVCAAAGLLWLSANISAHSEPPTQVVSQNPTETIPSISPTSLPIPTASLTTPTTDSALRPPPDQAVRNYYQLVSQKRYDLTWSMLTDTFKQRFNCCAPNYDYAGYVSWWNSVNHVEFGTVSTISQNGDQAIVYAELYYVMNTGARSSIDSAPYFELVYAAGGTWRFNDKRASP